MGRGPHGPSVPALKELHRALVLLGRGARLERSQVPAPAGFGIDLARIEAVLAGSQLSDHPWHSSEWTSVWSAGTGVRRAARTANSSKRIVSFVTAALPRGAAAGDTCKRRS